MDSFTDKNRGAAAGSEPEHTGQLQDPKRRSFSRKALVGSAVLLSLGNRAAWGQATNLCMSVATINSFDPTSGVFISAPAGANGFPGQRPDHNANLANEIHRISSEGTDYVGTGIGSDGNTYSSCVDPGSADKRCLVQGEICPDQ